MRDDPATYELPGQILRFLLTEEEQGRQAALIAVTDLAGGSMRQVGSLSAVSESGQMAGYVSNGCIDADIALQASETLKTGAVTPLRYGAGSPFIDLQLPCGGSVDIVIDPRPDLAVVKGALADLDARKDTSIGFDRQQGLVPATSSRETQTFTLKPAPRLIVAGRGPALRSVVTQAQDAGFAVAFATPDEADQKALADTGAEPAFEMTSPWSPVSFDADSRTAVLLLFHDHIWEAQILSAAVRTDAFYIGCLGSPETHRKRVEVLQTEGLTHPEIDRIKGPVGLVPSMRSAPFLGLSFLAEIVETLIARDKQAAAPLKSEDNGNETLAHAAGRSRT